MSVLAMLHSPPLPPVSDRDLRAFPGEAEVARQLAFSEKHLAFLLERRATHGSGWGLEAWQAEALWRNACWKALDDAQSHCLSDMKFWTDGDQLRWLREQVGTRNYYQGRMPDACPYYLFNRVDP